MNSITATAFSAPASAATTASASANFSRHISNTDLLSLRRMAAKLARNAINPDKMLQDALERACRNFDRFQPGTSMKAWLRTIMQRLVIDDWRSRSSRREVEVKDLVAPDAAEPEPVWSRYSLDEVRRASLHLPEPLRTTFRLRLVGGLGYSAIAQRQGIPPSTVATRLRRSRMRIRDLLEGGKVSPLCLVATTEGRGEPSSDKSCHPWSPRRSPSASSRQPSRQPMTATGSSPRPSLAAIGGRSWH